MVQSFIRCLLTTEVGFSNGQVSVSFVVNDVALDRLFSEYFLFCSQHFPTIAPYVGLLLPE
jgi:hypothetical protein